MKNQSFVNLGAGKVNFIHGDGPSTRQQLSAAKTAQAAPAQVRDLAWALKECNGDMDLLKRQFPEIWKAESLAFQGRYSQRVTQEGGRC